MVAGIGLAATFGAGVTAQLGAMRINEEIDALESMAIRPVEYLVSTRIVAGMAAITPLYSIAVILSFFGKPIRDRGVVRPVRRAVPALLRHLPQPARPAVVVLPGRADGADDPAHSHLFRLFRLRRPVRVGRCGRQRGADVADRRRIGDSACLTGDLRIQRQLQPGRVAGDGQREKEQERPRCRPPTGHLLTVVAVVVIVAVAVGLFRGSFTRTVPVTVVAERAGLEMNPDAKVKLHGAEVGKVATIDELPDGRAALHLAIDPAALSVIPADVGAAITSSTVFGAKFVELVPPASPSSAPLESGTVITGSGHVTVELNTVFQQLVAVLSTVDPAKLNQTLGAVSTALGGRGAQFGQTLADLDSALVTLNPALESLNHDLGVAAPVFGAVADAAPDLLSTVANATRISDTVVDEQRNLDALLLSAIGLADVGTEVLSANRAPLTELLHLLVPTTDLTNQYNPAITCGLGAMSHSPTAPGYQCRSGSAAGFFLGRERYRYPHNLPKVAAKGGPQCTDLPKVGLNSGRRS